jgi:hypothetical protein
MFVVIANKFGSFGMFGSTQIHSIIHSYRGIANAACPYVASSGLYQSAVIHSLIRHVPKTWLLIGFDSEVATR